MCPTVWHLQKIHGDICTLSDSVPIVKCHFLFCCLLSTLLPSLRGQRQLEERLMARVFGTWHAAVNWEITTDHLFFSNGFMPFQKLPPIYHIEAFVYDTLHFYADDTVLLSQRMGIKELLTETFILKLFPFPWFDLIEFDFNCSLVKIQKLLKI